MIDQEDSRPSPEQQSKILKGDLVKNILKPGFTIDPNTLQQRQGEVLFPDFNQKRETGLYKNFG